ncbi:MAG: uroporphyrinogen-III synthase [Gammaproteobacteria bacterium]|nr:uroporphyrinogen-III synthase [Gammaproteobacteria bacterium]
MARYLRRACIQSSVAPLVQIQGISTVPPKETFDLAVYLSQHTALCIAVGDVVARRHMAIGPATERALSFTGVSCELPERFSSAGLLDMVSETLDPGSSVLIICGEGGITLFPERLRNLNYSVSVWRVYRRVQVSRKPRLERDCGLVELSSVTSMQAYRKTVRRHALVSTEEPYLVVPSRRVGKQGRLLGFARVHVAADASSRSFARVIRRLFNGS